MRMDASVAPIGTNILLLLLLLLFLLYIIIIIIIITAIITTITTTNTMTRYYYNHHNYDRYILHGKELNSHDLNYIQHPNTYIHICNDNTNNNFDMIKI